MKKLTKLFEYVAISKWITSVTQFTTAYWNMIDYIAVGIKTTSSWTRILTLVSYTGTVGWTIGIDNTFRSTIFIRISIEIGQTSALR